MCVIIYKPKGVMLPSSESLYDAFITNPDGAGLMIRRKRGITIKKGLMTFEVLMEAIEEYQANRKEVELGIHCRIATSGSKSTGMTHPFPISESPKLLRKLGVRVPAALMFNGIIHNFDYSNTASDIALYVKLLSGVYSQGAFDAAVNLLEPHGKFLIFTKIKTYRIGEWELINGVWYSNLHHLEEDFLPIQYHNYRIQDEDENEDGGNWANQLNMRRY